MTTWDQRRLPCAPVGNVTTTCAVLASILVKNTRVLTPVIWRTKTVPIFVSENERVYWSVEPVATFVGGNGILTVPVVTGGLMTTGGVGVSTQLEQDERARSDAMRLYLIIMVENKWIPTLCWSRRIAKKLRRQSTRVEYEIEMGIAEEGHRISNQLIS